MVIYDNGVYREMTDPEVAFTNKVKEEMANQSVPLTLEEQIEQLKTTLADADEMNVDQELRLLNLELGVDTSTS